MMLQNLRDLHRVRVCAFVDLDPFQIITFDHVFDEPFCLKTLLSVPAMLTPSKKQETSRIKPLLIF